MAIHHATQSQKRVQHGQLLLEPPTPNGQSDCDTIERITEEATKNIVQLRKNKSPAGVVAYRDVDILNVAQGDLEVRKGLADVLGLLGGFVGIREDPQLAAVGILVDAVLEGVELGSEEESICGVHIGGNLQMGLVQQVAMGEFGDVIELVQDPVANGLGQLDE